MNEGYKSISDIVKEVAEEEGMTHSEVRDVWEHQKRYVKTQMETEGVYAIFLPFIGTLSLNTKQFSKEIKNKIRKTHSLIIDKVEKLSKHSNYTKYKNSHKRVTGVNRLARYIIRHYETGIDKNKKLIAHKKCWKTIYKYSNNNFIKKQELITEDKNE